MFCLHEVHQEVFIFQLDRLVFINIVSWSLQLRIERDIDGVLQDHLFGSIYILIFSTRYRLMFWRSVLHSCHWVLLSSLVHPYLLVSHRLKNDIMSLIDRSNWKYCSIWLKWICLYICGCLKNWNMYLWRTNTHISTFSWLFLYISLQNYWESFWK